MQIELTSFEGLHSLLEVRDFSQFGFSFLRFGFKLFKLLPFRL